MDANTRTVPVTQQASERERATSIRNKRGDMLGADWVVPKGDFGRFLGYKEPSEKELAGDVSGSRAIEVALQKQMRELGRLSMKNGEAYRNMYVPWGRFENQPGREKDMIQSGLDSIRESVDMGSAMGIRYLEMQFKFDQAGKNFGTISNLMRVRGEAVKKAINEVR